MPLELLLQSNQNLLEREDDHRCMELEQFLMILDPDLPTPGIYPRFALHDLSWSIATLAKEQELLSTSFSPPDGGLRLLR